MNSAGRWAARATLWWALAIGTVAGSSAQDLGGGPLWGIEPGAAPLESPRYAEPQRLPEHGPLPVAAPPAVQPLEFEPVAAVADVRPAADPALPEDEYFTLDELKAEMKKLAWTKGDFRIVPYGILWGNMVWESQRSNPGDYTLYVFSADDISGDDFHVNARNTRLGLNVTGPQVPCLRNAPSGGKVEIDFWGQFLGGENKPGVLLRHAYCEVKDDTFRLLAGQTWDVISPLYPGTLMYSVGWGGGNIGYRRAQFRYERYLACSDLVMLQAEGALAADLFSELSPDVGADHGGWPVLQARVGTTLGPRGPNCRPMTFGVSGHVGEQEFLFGPGPLDDEVARTWSFNVDVRVPISERLGVQGELFTGENLGTYLGGVVQGLNLTTRDPIRSRGGWIDVWYDWTPRLHSHVGYSLDDPIDGDVTNGRTYNHFIFANLGYDLTKDFLVGFEYSSWKTLYNQKSPGISDHFDFVVKYGF